MKFTFFNEYERRYEVLLHHGNEIHIQVEPAEYINNNVIRSEFKKYMSGDFIDKLARYENTGLKPEEFGKLKGLPEKIQKLEEENKHLRCLLKCYLDK